MKYVKISSKNQITLGAMVMDALNVQPYDKLYIEIENGKAVLHPAKDGIVKDLSSKIKPSKKKFTEKEIKEFMKKKYPKKLLKKYESDH